MGGYLVQVLAPLQTVQVPAGVHRLSSTENHSSTGGPSSLSEKNKWSSEFLALSWPVSGFYKHLGKPLSMSVLCIFLSPSFFGIKYARLRKLCFSSSYFSPPSPLWYSSSTSSSSDVMSVVS